MGGSFWGQQNFSNLDFPFTQQTQHFGRFHRGNSYEIIDGILEKTLQGISSVTQLIPAYYFQISPPCF